MMHLVTSPIDNTAEIRLTLKRLGWKLEDDNLIELCRLLNTPRMRWSLQYHLQSGPVSFELVELLPQIGAALNNSGPQMHSHRQELADARLQLLRLYRAIDQHSWKFMPWVLEFDSRLSRRLLVAGLCLTPSSSFG